MPRTQVPDTQTMTQTQNITGQQRRSLWNKWYREELAKETLPYDKRFTMMQIRSAMRRVNLRFRSL